MKPPAAGRGEGGAISYTPLGREEHLGWIWFWREIALSMWIDCIREQGYDMRAYRGEGFFRVRVCITVPPGLGPLVPPFVHRLATPPGARLPGGTTTERTGP